MGEFIEVEWFGRQDYYIGIVLTYDWHDGFKARMSPLPRTDFDHPKIRTQEEDIKFLMENAAKIPFSWAWGIFGPRMKSEWMKRHLKDQNWPTVRYDGVDYDVKTLEQIVKEPN